MRPSGSLPSRTRRRQARMIAREIGSCDVFTFTSHGNILLSSVSARGSPSACHVRVRSRAVMVVLRPRRRSRFSES